MKKKLLQIPVICFCVLLVISCKKSIGPLNEEQVLKPTVSFKNLSETDAALPGSNYSRGFGINNSGALTGSVRNADGKVVAFMLKNNGSWFSDEEVSSNGLPEIRFSINDPGDIAGHKIVPGGIIPIIWKNGQAYELQPLAGQQFGEVYDINNSGQMVGESLNGNFVTPTTMRATLFSLDRPATDLGTLGGAKASAAGINEDGDIVGVSDLANGQSHAFLYTEGTMYDLGTLGGTISNANAINNNNEIVGRSTLANGAIRAFLYKEGVMYDLGTLGGAASVAFDINDKGEVVGFARVANGQAHAFLYKDGVMQDLGTLGGTDSRAYGINNRGDIIGQYTKTDGSVHAFVYRDGQMFSL
jgi:probable HAF family extracellular repeat protein